MYLTSLSKENILSNYSTHVIIHRTRATEDEEGSMMRLIRVGAVIWKIARLNANEFVARRVLPWASP